MNVILESNLQTLSQTKSLLKHLKNDTLCDASVAPYYSSIGSHVRHILDFYDCILHRCSANVIDLTARKRNQDIESKCDEAKAYLSSIISKLQATDFDMFKTIFVIDDLGSGKVEMPYTFSALFAQANSHTIHHYAIINYIANRLKISIEDSYFGYNPTTPRTDVTD